MAEAKDQDPDVVLIGASIIQLIQCYPIWNDKFVPLKSLNFGISGDRTQDVLWRVKNNILDHIKPKVCINHFYLMHYITVLENVCLISYRFVFLMLDQITLIIHLFKFQKVYWLLLMKLDQNFLIATF